MLVVLVLDSSYHFSFYRFFFFTFYFSFITIKLKSVQYCYLTITTMTASCSKDLQHSENSSNTDVLDILALIVCKCLSLELTRDNFLVFFPIRHHSCLQNKVIALFVVILGPILQPIEPLALTTRFWCTNFHPNIVLEVALVMNIISWSWFLQRSEFVRIILMNMKIKVSGLLSAVLQLAG